ncbi:Laccase domain protein [Sporotomaculum syntrophicum]|uniref:Purine nucleoside phosphorylase n=1 Tax=Sporotomaculum syntrophicum TaxID=182264 RepID=A0A9D2WQ06_9FIRM|nr:peptidoglycan editing factor PgeF [Sporotomaculum syntrophicum]KAF1084816.1 Laccase domain protein [Sporotomaculum syntrophicum]
MQGGFILNKSGELAYLTVPSFTATGSVTHAFTTRLGGVSPTPYGSLNLGLHVGDELRYVVANRQRICQALGANMNWLVAGEQVHGDRVVTVGAAQAGRGAISIDDALPGVDALVTDEPLVLLSSYYADCVPLLFLDPMRRVIALAHAGWKGTVQNIGTKTVHHMLEMHGCLAENILAAVGPAIGACCYEVDAPVMEAVERVWPGGPIPARPGQPGRWWLDLPAVNWRLLLGAGVRAENITMAGCCTACCEDLFFSYRRQDGPTGRMASLIMLQC